MNNDLDALYHLKPFDWEEKIFTDREIYNTKTWGGYRVKRTRYSENSSWGNWVASYCFDEFYDEDYAYFGSLEEAKEWCWNDWVKRITPHLIKTRI